MHNRETLITELVRYFKTNDKLPTKRELNSNLDFPNYSEYKKTFGGLKTAIISANLTNEVKHKNLFDRRPYSDKELLDTLKNYIEANNFIPSAKEFNKDNSTLSSGVYVTRFGGFNNALAMIGYKGKYIQKERTNEELLEDLYNLYIMTGEPPTSRTLNKSKVTTSHTIYLKRFGSMYNAYRLANIPFNRSVKELNKEEIISYWYDLKNKLGRIPTIIDMENSEINIYGTMHDKTCKWNNYYEFLQEIGEDSGFKNNFGGTRYKTKMGTLCLSYYEFIITEWFEDNEIEFKKEVFYRDMINNDNTKRRFDWVIIKENEVICIEMFGMMNVSSYKDKIKRKIQDCKDANIKLIALYPQNVINKPLNEVFSFLNT